MHGKSKVINFLISGCVLLALASGADIDYPNTTINDNLVINPGTVLNLIGGSASLAINLNGNLTVRGPATINIPNASSLYINGNTYITGNGIVAIVGNGSNTLYVNNTGGSAYIRNARITNFGTALRANQGGTVQLEKTQLQGSNNAMYLAGAALTARFCHFRSTGTGTLNRPVILYGTITNPVAEFCLFEKNAGDNHIYVPAGSNVSNLDLEGSRSTSGTLSISGTTSYDAVPLSTAGHPLATNISDALVFPGGSVNFSKDIPPNTYLNLSGGLTMASGQTLNIGRSILPGVGWLGGSTVKLTSGGLTLASGSSTQVYYSSITGVDSIANNGTLWLAGSTVEMTTGGITNSGTFTSNTDVFRSASTWSGFTLASGSSSQITNTTISNATIGITDQSSSANVANCTFSSFGLNTTVNRIGPNATNSNKYTSNKYQTQAAALEITGGSPVVSSSTFGQAAARPLTISGGSPQLTNNSFSFNNTAGGSAVYISGGTPVFQNNTVSGYSSSSYALNISGSASIPAGNFLNNNFSAANPRVTAGVGSVVKLENNYWGAAKPSTANFSGTAEIDYEPWRNASGGSTEAREVPQAVFNITPASGTIFTSGVSSVNFSLEDLGYHNGTPLQYGIQIANNANFTSPLHSSRSGAAYPRGGAATHTFSAINTPGTYYWRVSVNNTTDTAGWGAYPPAPGYFTFSIRDSQINLTLAASKTQASAGEQVNYTLNFDNPESFAFSNVKLTAILPDDVYWNGTVQLSNMQAMGSVTVQAYADLNGTQALGSYTGVPGSNSFIPPVSVPEADNHRVRRFDVTITTLSASGSGGSSGAFTYQTLVK